MARWAYVNGRYLPHGTANISIEDRGLQFADSVYEVIAICRGRLVDRERHLDRLEYSLGALEIAAPMSRRALTMVLASLIARNRVQTGSLYLQVSRGIAPRDFKFPRPAQGGLRPPMVGSVIATTRRLAEYGSRSQIEDGVGVLTVPDQRWTRRDVKTTCLLAQVLAKEAAVRSGAYEAWMVGDDGWVTEGSSSNAWIVTPDGTLRTHPANQRILKGITRQAVLEIAAAEGLPVVERPFTVEEAYGAREAFLTSTTNFMLPIVRINDRTIGDGRPGPVLGRLRQLYCERATHC